MSKDLIQALEHVLREALNAVEVHPCDVNDDDIRARFLPGPMADLYKALSRHRSSVESVELPEGEAFALGTGLLWPGDAPPEGEDGCEALYTASTVRRLIAEAVERERERERFEADEKVLALADRIDHEQLWSRPAIEHLEWPQDMQDRMLAGVMLRRYAELMAPKSWRLFQPAPGCSFRASTLDAVVEMARKDQVRRAAIREGGK